MTEQDQSTSAEARVPLEPLVRALALLLACLLIGGCDAEREAPINATDIGVIVSACKGNDGLNQAQRAQPVFGPREWRIDCADGARFVLPAP